MKVTSMLPFCSALTNKGKFCISIGLSSVAFMLFVIAFWYQMPDIYNRQNDKDTPGRGRLSCRLQSIGRALKIQSRAQCADPIAQFWFLKVFLKTQVPVTLKVWLSRAPKHVGFITVHVPGKHSGSWSQCNKETSMSQLKS